MALRAGYYGLKGSVKKALEKLAGDTVGMKIIKSFGDGLNLTNAGKLNLTAATAQKLGGVKVGSGLSIIDGVLDCTVTGGFDYSTTEFETGQEWIDGKPIYGKVLTGVSVGTNSYGTAVDTGVKIDKLIDLFSTTPNADGAYVNHLIYGTVTGTTTSSVACACSITSLTNANVVILYTKVEEETS